MIDVSYDLGEFCCVRFVDDVVSSVDVICCIGYFYVSSFGSCIFDSLLAYRFCRFLVGYLEFISINCNQCRVAL